MERLVQVDRDQLAAQLHRVVDQILAKVMDAVNEAKDGRLIEDSEGPVFQLMKELESRVFQGALQLRVDSTESTFSPSQGPAREKQTEQRTRRMLETDATGTGEPLSNAVLRPGRRKRGSAGQADR